MAASRPDMAATSFSPVTGEFRDAETELRFRKEQHQETVNHARFLFALAAIVIGIFFVANLLLTEGAPVEQLVLTRSIVIAASIFCFFVIDRVPSSWIQPMIVIWIGTLIIGSASMMSIQRNVAEGAMFFVPAMIYLALPSPFRTTVSIGVIASALLFAFYTGVGPLSGADTNLLVALVLANGVLVILKSRSGLLVRRAWLAASSYRETLGELEESKRTLERVFMAVPTPLLIATMETGIINKVNGAAEKFLGLPAQMLVGRHATDFYADPSERATFTNLLKRSGLVHGFRSKVRTIDGTERTVSVSASAIADDGQEARHLVTNMHDVTEIDSRERRLMAAKTEYQALFENSVIGIYRSTPEGRMLRANPALVRFNGYDTEAELIEAVEDIQTEWYVLPGRRQQWLDLMRDDGRATDFVSEVYRHRTRERVWISESSWIVRDGEGHPLYFEGMLIEATDRKRAEDEYQHMARHDQLTNLANRWLLTERLEQALSWVHRYGGHFAVICIDLDHFKPVNDAFGHATGDLLLQEAARRLKSVCRAEDTVARLGGDEFAVLCTGVASSADLAATATRILGAFEEPFSLDGPRAQIGASIGIAVAPEDADDAKTLLARADEALYQAKADGRNRYRFCDPEAESTPAEPGQVTAS